MFKKGGIFGKIASQEGTPLLQESLHSRGRVVGPMIWPDLIRDDWFLTLPGPPYDLSWIFLLTVPRCFVTFPLIVLSGAGAYTDPESLTLLAVRQATSRATHRRS